jgi:ParB family chromosome partitioning protein
VADSPKKKTAAPRKKKAKTAPEPRGLSAKLATTGQPPAALERLGEAVVADGGAVIGGYRDPLGGHWQLLVSLPIELLGPTPYQRDLSEPHVAKLADAIGKLDRFLDPLIATRTAEGTYWTPNGHHRLAAMRALGAQSITALLVPEPDIAHRMLVLNTEKAHNVRERALAVIRLAEGLAQLDDRPEREFATEFEEPALITLGLCYQQNGRFSGGGYYPVLKRIETFLSTKLVAALATRRERAERLMELDQAVVDVVRRLKERGFESPYLKAFVLARINPLRFRRAATADWDDTIDKMLAAAKKFDTSRIKVDQVARAGGSEPDGA